MEGHAWAGWMGGAWEGMGGACLARMDWKGLPEWICLT